MHQIDSNSDFTFKNSINRFVRTLDIPDYRFDGAQWSSYSEAAYHHRGVEMDWVGGLNFYSDDFEQRPDDTPLKLDYAQYTLGAFLQNTWQARDWLHIEAGLRGDHVFDYGWVLRPRLSALFKLGPKLSSRIGGGMGYKTPSIFTEETECIQLRNVLPVDPKVNTLEKSYGGNVDVNYQTRFFDAISFSVNQLFFYTKIQRPLLLQPTPDNQYQLQNVDGHVDIRGWETNVKLSYQDFKLFIGYTFTDASLNEQGTTRPNPLTAKHRLNNVLMYEKEDQWKIGLEAYYYCPQTLINQQRTRPYWIFGFMAEKIWDGFSLFANFENFTDTRQTRFDSIYTGTLTQPVFKEIYAPLDGFVINGGIKFHL